MELLSLSEQIEKMFTQYFQRNISMYVGDTCIKQGKFLLIRNCVAGNNFFYELTIERARKLDVMRLPYPFRVEDYPDENLMYLDYRISTLCGNDPDLIAQLQAWAMASGVKTPNKLVDRILEIKFN